MSSWLSLAALALTLLLAGCGGGDGDAGGDTRVLVLTDEGCTYEGDTTSPPDTLFEATIENRSASDVAVELLRIDRGTFDDVEEYVESQHARLEDGAELEDHPGWLAVLNRTDVDRGWATQLFATLTAGEYVFTCTHGDPPTAMFLVERSLEVAG